MNDLLRRNGHGRRKRSRIRFPSLARNPGVLVLVIGVAGRTAGLLHVLPNHRHDDVIGETPLPGTVVVQNVTKPRLALLHQETPDGSSLAGKEIAKGGNILAELVFEWQ
jgi:hypothetical protein